MQDQGETIKKNSAALVKGPGFPSINTAISLSCFEDTETLTRWEKLPVNDTMLPTAHTAQIDRNKKVDNSSVAQSCLTLRHHGLQHARLPCPSLSPRVCLNSCLLSQ